jgi:hypothetical protein
VKRKICGLSPQGKLREASALKMLVPKAPWSAVAPATAVRSNTKAATSLPHSKALRAFSWFLSARPPTGMSDCIENQQMQILRSAQDDTFRVSPQFNACSPVRTIFAVQRRLQGWNPDTVCANVGLRC